MERRLLALLGVSALIAGIVACGSSEPAVPVAPTSTGSNTGPDGSTLKVTASTPQSPINDQRLTTDVVTLTASASSGTFASGLPLQYRFQLFNGAGAMVQESGLMSGPAWQVSTTLVGNQRYTWRVRPEYQGEAGPWSGSAAFITSEPFVINDPLTNGTTVGSQVGGHFVGGLGWQSDSTIDGIDYDLATPCSSCTLEFDSTNFGKKEGEPFGKDLKWITMADANSFGNFGAFRDGPWKMHLEQRADGDGTGMKLIWRNGGFGDGEPGDHTGKLGSAVDWQSNQVFHFMLDWSPQGFTVAVNGEVWFQDGFGGNPYTPAPHRISLGCYPRGESFVGAIYRNVTLKKH
jgi:hypothetical protein